jgi:hypothetical protein
MNFLAGGSLRRLNAKVILVDVNVGSLTCCQRQIQCYCCLMSLTCVSFLVRCGIETAELLMNDIYSGALNYQVLVELFKFFYVLCHKIRVS